MRLLFIYETKKSKEVVRTLSPISRVNKIKHLQTHTEKQFFNVRFQSLLNNFNINRYSTFQTKRQI